MAQSAAIIKLVSHDQQLASEVNAFASKDIVAVRSIADQRTLDTNDRIVFLDVEALAHQSLKEWRQSAPDAIFICELDSNAVSSDYIHEDCLLIPHKAPPVFLQNALKQALQISRQRLNAGRLKNRLKLGTQKLQELSRIGAELSSQRDHTLLIEEILRVGRSMANCDAASLFLMDEEAEELIFKHAQNDSVEFDFVEARFPLSHRSVAGFAALNKQKINIADVYQIPENASFKFNNEFDQSTGYRTCSMLVLPMIGHNDQVIGVIQFINRKDDMTLKLSSEGDTLEHTLPFSEEDEVILRALVSQAAIAIENNTFIEQLDNLFEGFVNASVRAIEYRDPTTSGHSFRVAELTCALAACVRDNQQPEFRQRSFTKAQMRELRYASLLHDFGKVSVREHVLVKANKLDEANYAEFIYRIALEKERITNHYLLQKIDAMNRGQFTEEFDHRWQHELAHKTKRLDEFLQVVVDANKPSLLSEEASDFLHQVKEYQIDDLRYGQRGLITDDELHALSVKRGSLTEEERYEIEGHVRHTISFLSRIPWPSELCHVVDIAGAHHEKLNGTGYPNKLSEDEIPYGSKIMAVCDIFDALTASDRPYKAAVPLDRAMTILQSEVESEHIDADLVQLFEQQKVYQVLPDFQK